MNEWTELHNYNKLVNEGRAVPLGCPDCQDEFAWTIGQMDEPVAWCATEDKKFYPGTLFWANVKRVVEENRDD